MEGSRRHGGLRANGDISPDEGSAIVIVGHEGAISVVMEPERMKTLIALRSRPHRRLIASHGERFYRIGFLGRGATTRCGHRIIIVLGSFRDANTPVDLAVLADVRIDSELLVHGACWPKRTQADSIDDFT